MGVNAENDWEDKEDVSKDEDCDGCKWWSELCAKQIGIGPMEALCLNPESPNYQRFTFDGCPKYEDGRSVDDPSRQ